MLKKSYIFPLLITFLLPLSIFAGGIRGIIKNTKGEQLSFASIIVKGSSKGTMANEEGAYELSLEKGSYTIIFQYLSHKTLEKTVEVGSEFMVWNPVLEEQSVALNEVRFSAKAEDPAYTIMRKAISMARFKVLELDSYTARTYVKGNGKVNEVSGLMKMIVGKKIEKEAGIKIGQVYVIESINDINFKQPSNVKEKVISSRNNLPKQLQDNINFLTVARANFYTPKTFGDMISPLSPSALAYYKFKYEGDFNENGLTVNKIRVIPKSDGENVFSGVINIIEDSWYIYSLDFQFKDDNSQNTVKLVYSPFKEVWMPVSFSFHTDFGAFGVNASFNYVTNVRNYALSINEKYHQKPVVIDEKIDKAEAADLKGQKVDGQTALKQKQLTRKQLEKFLKSSEKEDRKERKSKGEDVALVRSYSLEIDTLSKKRTNDFWNEERQVPLTEFEVKGYAQADSITKANEGQFKKDSIKNLPIFKFPHLIMGKTYNYGIKDPLYRFYPRTLTYSSPIFSIIPLMDFVNSVDGYYLQSSLIYQTRDKLLKRTSLYANFRYALGRNAFNINSGYYYYDVKKRLSFEFKIGRYVQQYNENQPISPIANTLYTMFAKENYLKIYNKDYLNFEYKNRFSQVLGMTINLEYSQKKELQNLAERDDREFSSNRPENVELKDSKFVNPEVLTADFELTFRPFAKKREFNNFEITVNQGNPTFRLKSTNGLFSDGNYSKLQGSYEQIFDLEKIGDLHVLANYGGFLKAPSYLSDFRHFNGNKTILRSFSFDAFRNLDYYLHSTKGNYLEIFAANDFQKFLLTQITPLRIYGLKESIFANYLNIPNQNFNYVEVGYGISGIEKFLGLEVVGNFVNGQYGSTVLRVKLNR
jgi:hypothetical protein